MTRILKEPLLHFLLLGGLLFALSGAGGSDSGDSDKQIIVGEGRIEQLAAIFAKTWQRPPTRQELEGLVDDFILEEIYYRQALEMGLDRDDTMIRRRLRQKLEFLTDDAASLLEPTDEDLTAFLNEHAAQFRRGNLYTFRQVYFSPDRHGDALEEHVASRLAALRAGETVDGDSNLLAESFDNSAGRIVDRSFGSGFAEQLDKLPTGEWQGPIRSGLGLHLVRLESRTEGTLPELDEIRSKIEREWAHARRLETRSQVNEKLLKDYEVTIEWPDFSSTDTAPGS